MQNRLIDSFNTAVTRYINMEYRGYKSGLFSSIRHSFRKNDKMRTLENALHATSKDIDALQLIIESDGTLSWIENPRYILESQPSQEMTSAQYRSKIQ